MAKQKYNIILKIQNGSYREETGWNKRNTERLQSYWQFFWKKGGECIVIRALLITFYRYLLYKYSFVPIQYFIKKLKGGSHV